VRKGGGLFVALGDNAEAAPGDDLEKPAYAVMAPLLAQELRAVRDVAPGQRRADRVKLGETVGRFEKTHPIFDVFSARGAGLVEARFWRWFLVNAASRPDRQILARLSGGAPLLVEARSGNGRLLLFTSTIDRDWTNLPVHKGFLPLMQQAARYLARAPAKEGTLAVLVGQSRDVTVGEADRRLEVSAPSGGRTSFEKERLEGRKAVAFSATNEPGVYRVLAAGEDGTARPRPGADFVVNVDPRGSDTRRAPASALPDAGATVASSGTDVVRPARRVELWHSLAAALLLFLFGEAMLARR
jgi:hypothetical protein